MPTSSIDFFQLSPMPMWVHDIKTHEILEVNPAAIKFLWLRKGRVPANGIEKY